MSPSEAFATSVAPLPIVEARGLSVAFGAIKALSDVSLSLHQGVVYGIVGPNGAGKSTVVKVLAGLLEPTAGSLWIDGKQAPLGDQHYNSRLGLRLVPQETSLIETMSVEVNINLGDETSTFGLLDGRQLRRRAREVTDMLGLHVSPWTRVDQLTLAEKRLVMVAKALSTGPRLLILDEPTAAMTATEAARVLEAVTRLRSRGVTTVLITHRFDEVVNVCDEVVGVRDGHVAQKWERSAPATVADLVAFVTAGGSSEDEHPSAPTTTDTPLIRARGIAANELQETDLEIFPGEVIGVIGRPGSGAEQLLDVLGGATPAKRGSVEIAGAPTVVSSPAAALRAGVGYLCSDRSKSALPSASVAENIMLSALRHVSIGGALVRSRLERAAARAYVPDGLEPRLDHAFSTLSGGNRQRVLFARLVAAGAKVFLLVNPTAGVDVAGRRRLREDLRQLAEGGRAIMVYSSEPEELLGLAHRVLVFDNGRIREVLESAELTQSKLLSAAMMASDINE